jgi:hypothetical protein
VKRIGCLLMVLAITLAILALIFEPIYEILYAPAGLAMILGALVMLIYGSGRIIRGEVVLRPRDAWKEFLTGAPIMFAVYSASIFFGLSAQSYWEALFLSIITSAGISLSTTAYRRSKQ